MRLVKCCSVYNRLFRLTSPVSRAEFSKDSESAREFRVLRVARTTDGEYSFGDRTARSGEII